MTTPSPFQPAAFITDVVRGREALLRQARRMLRDGHGAEDAVQDAMVAALRHAGRFRGEARVSTWLSAVLMGLRRDRRAAARVRRAAAEPGDTTWLNGSGENAPAPARLEAAERVRELRRMVAALPRRYREVVLLCDLDERPVEEVARSLGLSAGGVRTRRLRAHRMLRDLATR